MEQQKQHEKFMRMAIGLSEQNVLQAQHEPFGAVVVMGGKVIAKSANKVVATTDPTAHAEVAAIRLACKKLNTIDLSGATVYTSCEPCPMCLAALYWAKVTTIYYGNTKADAAAINFDDQFIYDELDQPMPQRQLPIKQLLRDEAQQAFILWQQLTMDQP